VEEEISIQVPGAEILLWPVDDPYGGPPEDYARAVVDIDAHVRRFVDGLRAQVAKR